MTNDPKCFSFDIFLIICKSFQNHAHDLLAPVLINLRQFRKATLILSIMLEHYPKGVQCNAGDSIIGAVLQTLQIFDKLIQFLGMQEQYKFTQILRNIFRKLEFTNFQTFCQFNGNFISLIPGKHRRQFYQCFPCRMTYRNLFANFQQI